MILGLRRLLSDIRHTKRSNTEDVGFKSAPVRFGHNSDPAPSTSTDEPRDTWIGNYRLIEPIGEGGMGVVYRAYDSHRDRMVALKTLQRVNAAALLRFKREFRSLAHLSHPNLVTLYEMLNDEGRWCFTMELLEGTTLLQHLRGFLGPHSYDKDRFAVLRDVFRQLTDGVVALHSADKLHRDIKPGNVMVTSEGRVVLLDFGLAAEVDESGLYQSSTDHIVGTVAYMSPEQAAMRPVSAASDWYAVGVMLYEVLTGHLPFDGSALEVLRAKLDREPPPPSNWASHIPDDLNALCVELLRRNPADRPSPHNVRAQLGRPLSESDQDPRSYSRGHDLPLVGRDLELGLLRDAYRSTRAGRAVVAFIRGESGVGKTALVRHFIEEASLLSGVVILSGRCYEQESVPFKALDSVLDALTRHLARLPSRDVEVLLPRDVRALTRVFPVLQQVDAIANAPQVGDGESEPHELRRRAGVALRELLARIGDRNPLILIIDDLQWGDIDSASLLSELLLPPDAPVFLGIGCCRTEDWSSSPFFKHLQQSRAGRPAYYDEREITVSPLHEDDTRNLVATLLRSTHTDSADGLIETIVREAAGRPFLVYELVEGLTARPGSNATEASLTLTDVLWRRIERLPQESRQLLEVISVAGRPISRVDASRAAALTIDDRTILPGLRASRLIRGASTDAGESLEPYHDRVRECVLAHLTPHALKKCHRHLAETFALATRPDTEILAVHLDRAGEAEQAADYYVEAASSAADALAFDHAGRLYRRALELKAWNPDDRRSLMNRLGDALSNAGRGAEAAQEYIGAADGAAVALSIELRHRAALQLLTSGHVDEGLAQLRPVLRSVGIRLTSASWQTLASLSVHRLRLRLRGLRFVERPEHVIPKERLQRIDIGWSVVIGLSIIDPIRGAEFQTRNLLLALTAGEPFRIARALAVEAAHLASSGASARAAQTIAEADRIAKRIRRPYATGMVELTRSAVAYFAQRWKESLELSRRAERTFREHCTGVTWEIDTANGFTLWSLARMGEIRELTRISPSMLKNAYERGDRFAVTNLSTEILGLISLGADDPNRAKAELERVMRQWSQQGYHVQHHDAVLASVPLELYADQPNAAWNRVTEAWASFRWSLLRWVQPHRIEMLQLRAYCALAMAAHLREKRHRFLEVATKDARQLRAEKLIGTTALADYIDGAVCALRGDLDSASNLLAEAVSGFEAIDACLHTAVVRMRLSRLLGGEAGESLRRDAERWFEAQDIVNPERLTMAFAPGFSN